MLPYTACNATNVVAISVPQAQGLEHHRLIRYDVGGHDSSGLDSARNQARWRPATIIFRECANTSDALYKSVE